MPFKKVAQRGFMSYDRDASRLRFAPVLWERIQDTTTRQQVRALSQTALSAYYQRLGQPGCSSSPRSGSELKPFTLALYFIAEGFSVEALDDRQHARLSR
jgi:hypothetical protein